MSFYFLLAKVVTFPFALPAHSITHHSRAVCLLFHEHWHSSQLQAGDRICLKDNGAFWHKEDNSILIKSWPPKFMIYVWKCQCLKDPCRKCNMSIRVGNLWTFTVIFPYWDKGARSYNIITSHWWDQTLCWTKVINTCIWRFQMWQFVCFLLLFPQ